MRMTVEEIETHIRIQEIVQRVIYVLSAGRRVVLRWETVRAA
jgi:hypothetical protein